MIVISEFMAEAAVERLRGVGNVHYAPDLADRQEDLPALLAEARALIVRNRTQVTKALLAAAPKLECVGRLGVGLDNIDLEACAARNVTVYPATGANTLSVAEYVITAALLLLRQSWFRTPSMIAGEWPRAEAGAGHELAGKTLGLVGYGAIAQATATMARAMGMEIAASDPFVPEDHPAWQGTRNLTLDQLYRDADVISLHVPLTPETQHMVNAATLSTMKPSAILINAARGGVVDDVALVAALNSGSLAGAALDTFETEPLNAEAGALFRAVPNLVLTPHIAGVSAEANVRVSELTADNVINHLAT